MVQPLDLWPETASQTAGPYVHIGLLPGRAGLPGIHAEEVGHSPVAEGAQGERVTIAGAVLDGLGGPVGDAIIESWQADATGLYPGQPGSDPAVGGFCRLATDAGTGGYRLDTVKPGPVRCRDGSVMAPHLSIWIVARGINIGLHSRIYFEDEDNEADPLLARTPHRARVQTLLARRSGPGSYRFDIHLQGPDETVFLDI